MGWLGVVDLKAGGECALSELVRVVAQECVVIAQEGIVDGGVSLADDQVLMLGNHLGNTRINSSLYNQNHTASR